MNKGLTELVFIIDRSGSMGGLESDTIGGFNAMLKEPLYLAQQEMNDRNIDKIMAMFAEINVSPVTISKRHNIEFLKNLYSYLLAE